MLAGLTHDGPRLNGSGPRPVGSPAARNAPPTRGSARSAQSGGGDRRLALHLRQRHPACLRRRVLTGGGYPVRGKSIDTRRRRCAGPTDDVPTLPRQVRSARSLLDVHSTEKSGGVPPLRSRSTRVPPLAVADGGRHQRHGQAAKDTTTGAKGAKRRLSTGGYGQHLRRHRAPRALGILIGGSRHAKLWGSKEWIR